MNGLANRIQKLFNRSRNSRRFNINKTIGGKIYGCLILLLLFTSCGLTQFKSTMTVSEDGRTVIMESNIPSSGKIKDAEIRQEKGKSLFEKIGDVVPNVEVAK